MIGTMVFAALLAAAAVNDVLRLRIPNVIPLLLVAGFVLEVGLGLVVRPLDHLLAMVIVLAILLPVFAFDMLGGGDVKLLAAAALWLGLANVPLLLICVGILGGLFTAFWLPLRWLVARLLPSRRLPASLRLKAALPYGVPISVVALLLHLDVAGELLARGG
jgi:prepilin peptidase CpaA